MSKLLGIDFGTSSTQVSYRDAGGGSTLLRFQVPANGSESAGVALDYSIPTLIAENSDGQYRFGFEVTVPTSDEVHSKESKQRITYSVKTEVVEASKLAEPRSHESFAKIVGFLKYVGELINFVDPSLNPFSEEVVVQMSCPVSWALSARTFLVEAATEAGYTVREGELIDEPIAASTSWLSSNRAVADESKCVVFDMGAGTLDLALVSIELDDTRITSAEGNNVAGDHIDDVLVEILRDRLDQAFGGNSWNSQPELEEQVRNTVRIAKESLSASKQQELTFRVNQEKTVTLTRKDLEASLSRPLMKHDGLEPVPVAFTTKAISSIEKLLRVGKMHDKSVELVPEEIRRIPLSELLDEVDHVILVGGSTEMLGLREWILSTFRNAKSVTAGSVDPETLLEAPRLAVGLGLSNADNPLSLNDFRPNYSIKFYWAGAPDGETIYEAYSPTFNFEDQWLLHNRVYAMKTWIASTHIGDLPTAPSSESPGGILAFVKPNGHLIRCDLEDGTTASGFFFAFGAKCSPLVPESQAARVRFTSNQVVNWVDGQGNTGSVAVKHRLRIENSYYIMDASASGQVEEVPEILEEFWSSVWGDLPAVTEEVLDSTSIAASDPITPDTQIFGDETAESIPDASSHISLPPQPAERVNDLSKSGTIWALEEDHHLAEAYVNGISWDAIASELLRKESAVIARAVMLCREGAKISLPGNYFFKEIQVDQADTLRMFLEANLNIEQVALAVGMSISDVFTFGFQERLLKPIDPAELERHQGNDSRPARHGSRWTTEEIEQLKEEVNSGLTLSDIADLHKRTQVSIFMKTHDLGGLNDGQLGLYFTNAHFY